MATTELGRPRGRLELPGSGSRRVTLEVIYQPRATRIMRAVLVLTVAAVLMPLVFFIPPHFLWPLLVLALGLYLARRYWVGEFYVSRFEGACPRCDTPLELKPGARIRQRQTLECYGCHRQPELVLESAEETARVEGFPKPAPDVERRRGDDRRDEHPGPEARAELPRDDRSAADRREPRPEEPARPPSASAEG